MNNSNVPIIDKTFLQNKPTWVYPGGEIGVSIFPSGLFKLTGYSECSPLCFRVQSSADLVELIMTTDAMKRDGYDIPKLHLLLPYLPYARQDRVAAQGDAHALKVFCKLVDDLGFLSVSVIDAHSNVSEACFDKTPFHNISPLKAISAFMDQVNCGSRTEQVLICPDEGAIKKTQAYAAAMNIERIVYCSKKRDPATGKLTGFTVNNEVVMNEAEQSHTHMILLDDIIDGGGTFLGIADAVRQLYPKVKLHLFATHGIFSKGVSDLFKKYDSVGSTTSFDVPDMKLVFNTYKDGENSELCIDVQKKVIRIPIETVV